VELFVDGTKILEISNIDTTAFGNADTINMGIIHAFEVQQNLEVYGDCLVYSESYIGPEQ
jgi:hypothetical protein